MNKLFRFATLLLACMLIIGVTDVDAQYGKKKKKKKKKTTTEENDDYFDESGGALKDKLWYGGMINFQVSGQQGSNLLVLGMSPMVGYKFNDRFSAGPRANINFFNFYVEGPNPKYLEWGIGAFARAKIINAIFAHAEYGYEKISHTNGPEIFTLPNGADNFLLGGGYNASGGGLGYEILILYNFLEESEFDVPIEYRVGFTWNF